MRKTKNIESDRCKWCCGCENEGRSGDDLYFDLLSFSLLLTLDICIISIFDIFPFFFYYIHSFAIRPSLQRLFIFGLLFPLNSYHRRLPSCFRWWISSYDFNYFSFHDFHHRCVAQNRYFTNNYRRKYLHIIWLSET